MKSHQKIINVLSPITTEHQIPPTISSTTSALYDTPPTSDIPSATTTTTTYEPVSTNTLPLNTTGGHDCTLSVTKSI